MKKKREEPSRFTVGQALAVFSILLVGFFILPDRLALVVLLAAMGVAAFLLNALFNTVLAWATRNDDEMDTEG
ncbi:MAG: hypothetical protein AAFV33_09090 [Chloroflexota bacterium]